MEADGESSPQLWSPPTTFLIPVHRRHGRTSPILNPEALILAIPILVLLIIFLVLPPFFSYANYQIIKPSLVQKGWDCINIFLVLIAVLCGVFANRNDDNSSSLDAGGEKNLDSVTDVSDDNIRKSIASCKWLDFPDKSQYDKMTSSRSYPDLRQESLWGCESNGFKCFDDFEVNFCRQPEKLYHRERRSQKVEETEAVAEPAPPVRRRRAVHRGRDDKKIENKSPPPPPAAQSLPPPPPPPPEPEFIPPVAEKAERIQREKGDATKEIATAIASLQYGTKKVKTRDYKSPTEDSLPPSAPAPPSTPPPPPPSKGLQSLLKKSSKSKHVHSVSTTAQPPPPPPPPPNSVFANIFKTGSKSMRSQLSSASSKPPPPRPPPPPPPPYSILNNIFSSGSKSRRCQIPSASSHPSPPPPTSSILIPSFENLTKSRRFKNSDTPTPPLPPPPGIHPVYTGKPPKTPKPNTSCHNETAIIVPPSPLIPMPPPPPPPFRTPEMNFVPKRDLARNRSTNRSQRSSPEVKNVHVMTIESDSGHSIRPSVSCPSPDVNTKADTFISRLRNGWRLEKLNSINERQKSVSSTSNGL